MVETSPAVGDANPPGEYLDDLTSRGGWGTLEACGCEISRGARGVPNGREKFRISALFEASASEI